VSSVSNGLYFLTLPLVSVTRVVYTSKGMLKKFEVRVIYRKIWYLCIIVIHSAPEVSLFRDSCKLLLFGMDLLRIGVSSFSNLAGYIGTS
jgi:hypothetical protein